MKNHNSISPLDKIYQAACEVTQDLVKVWLRELLWTWQWWLGVGLAIVPWLAWLVFRKKNSTDRLLYAGMFTLIIASWLDFLGVSFGLWSYSSAVVPTIPTFIPWDFCVIPVTTMFTLQIKPKLNPLIKAAIISGAAAFVVEPFFVWIGVYNPKEWKHIYSFGINVLIYLLAHFISKRKKFESL